MNIRISIPGHSRPLILAAAPKCGSSSLLHWSWRIAHGGQRFDGEDAGAIHHHEWTRQHWCGLDHGDTDALKVAVHRSGAERLVSVFNHWVVDRPNPDERDAMRRRFPDIATFARDLGQAWNQDAMLRWHTQPQALTLGTRQEAWDIILPMSKLSFLPPLIRQAFPGAGIPEMERQNVRNPALRPDDETLAWLRAFAAYDTRAGWDGKTVRLPFDDAASE